MKLELSCWKCVHLLSSFSIQTSEEVYEKMTGLIVPMDSVRNATMALNTSVHHMPRSLDYRKKGWVTSVKNQVSHLVLIASNQRVRLHLLFSPQSSQSISVKAFLAAWYGLNTWYTLNLCWYKLEKKSTNVLHRSILRTTTIFITVLTLK